MADWAECMECSTDSDGGDFEFGASSDDCHGLNAPPMPRNRSEKEQLHDHVRRHEHRLCGDCDSGDVRIMVRDTTSRYVRCRTSHACPRTIALWIAAHLVCKRAAADLADSPSAWVARDGARCYWIQADDEHTLDDIRGAIEWCCRSFGVDHGVSAQRAVATSATGGCDAAYHTRTLMSLFRADMRTGRTSADAVTVLYRQRLSARAQQRHHQCFSSAAATATATTLDAPLVVFHVGKEMETETEADIVAVRSSKNVSVTWRPVTPSRASDVRACHECCKEEFVKDLF